MPVGALEGIAPAWSWVPEYHDTLGPEVAELCEAVGFPPDPEQRLALDATFAFQRGGKSATRDVGLCAPRQNLKTGFLKMATLGWMYVLETRLVVWSAHEFRTSQEAFRDMCQLIENNPELDREVLRTTRGKTGISRGNGDEAIELRGDRRLVFKARTKAGGRGLTGDRVVLDEAMLLKPDMMAALVPTLRARPDPQLVFAGSAGLLESDIWRTVRDRGRAGGDPSLAWLEWGDPDAWTGCADGNCLHLYGEPGCAMDDEARWWATNTALGKRISVESLRTDRRLLPPIKFATETLGWWEDPPDDEQGDDILANWDTCADAKASTSGAVHLAVVVAHNLKAACIVACGAGADGLPVVDVVDYRRTGTAWVPERLAELRERHTVTSVGLVAGSPAASLLPLLPEDITVVSGVDFAAACSALAQDVNDAKLRHLGQQTLTISVANAVRRFAGDGWRWSLKESTSDISPLHGAVVARHLWAITEEYDPLANFLP
jgi:hypothetical protein